jgi:acetylornithine deacetylase
MEKSLVLKISKAVDSKREEALTFLRELIRFPTVVGTSYLEIQEFIARRLLKMKLVVDQWCPDIEEMRRYKWWTVPEHYYQGGFKDKPVVVGTYKGRGKGRSLIFNGHVEVVTPEPLHLWKHDPWGEIDEGKLYGRGAYDMKGGIAASILALECLQEIGVEINGDVIIESVYDEEIGGTGTDAANLRGYRADGAITPEPSNMNLTIACVGVMWFRVIVEGKSAHAAFVWDGINAIEKALKIHEVICAFGNERMKNVRHPLFEADYPIHATFNPGTFSAGGYPSSVPDKAILEYRIGLVPGEDNEKVFERIREIVKEASGRDAWLTDHPPKVELFGWYGKPTYLSEDHPLTQSVATAYKEVTGKLPRYNAITACGDMWRLHHLAGIPVVLFSCNGGGIHQNDEYIVINDYFDLIKILALTILNWCGHQ